MNEVEQNLQEIEIHVDELTKIVKQAEALQRLHGNADFKAVILSGYFEKESQRSVMLKSDINFAGAENQKQIDDIIIGIGMLGQYFHKIFTLGEQADRDLTADAQTREELLQEQISDISDIELSDNSNLVN
jgi:hypothetical protein